MPNKNPPLPVAPGSPCWVLPEWERGMVVAFDPAYVSKALAVDSGPVLVAWCSHADHKVSGVFPDNSTLTKVPAVYQRRDKMNGVECTSTVSCPPYLVVEWVPSVLVSFSPPTEQQRLASLDTVYEPVDAVLRNVPRLTQELWETKARLYGEHGDEKALRALPTSVCAELGIRCYWQFFAQGMASANPGCRWVCYTSKGMLVVEWPMPLGWTWKVLDENGLIRATAIAKYAVEAMAAAEAKYSALDSLHAFDSTNRQTGKPIQAPPPPESSDEDDNIPF